MQQGCGTRWEERRKEERLFLENSSSKKKPHTVKKPYNMEQITCHKQERNRKGEAVG